MWSLMKVLIVSMVVDYCYAMLPLLLFVHRVEFLILNSYQVPIEWFATILTCSTRNPSYHLKLRYNYFGAYHHDQDNDSFCYYFFIK